MADQIFKPRKIFVREDCLGTPLACRILDKLAGVPTEYIADEESLLQRIREGRDPISTGKSMLLLTRQRGDFVKHCPCTPEYVGCHYYIINLDLNCPLDCTYCILQGYLSNPLITVHVNTEDLWPQLDGFLSANDRPLRIGTGELGDSLALDPLTGRSGELIQYFRGHPKALFELKTKTLNIQGVLQEEPAENIIIAWSLNAAAVAAKEERGAPSADRRIEAARKVLERGYRVAFHFDPLVLFPGWEGGYRAVIKRLFNRIDRSRIAWISLGALRFPPALKPIIAHRFPWSPIIYEEMLQGRDGKLRYFKPLRERLFKKVIAMIREEGGGETPLYFCMEGQGLWRDCLGKKIKGKEEVERLLTLPC